jgi:hypothetical protein
MGLRIDECCADSGDEIGYEYLRVKDEGKVWDQYR